MAKIKLGEWDLTAHYPYTPILNKSLETGAVLNPIFPSIKAKVPGSVYMDLLEAGYIKDPYFDMDSMLCEWVPQRWWIYDKTLKIPEDLKGRNIFLTFSGIDYKAHISFNKQNLTKEAPHEGMFLPFTKNVTELAELGGENNIRVILESAPDEMGQIGYTSRTFTQKSRFNYKWDWCTRMIGMGLYGEAVIEDFGSCAIRYANIKTAPCENGGYEVSFELEIEGFQAGKSTVGYELWFGGELVCSNTAEIETLVGQNSFSGQLKVKNPKLWNPNGYGEQNLYNLRITVLDQETISDQKQYKVGLKTISYERCIDSPEGALPYIPVINGKRIYIKGVNMSPCEMMYGCETKSKLEKLFSQAKASNINLVRIWGGGAIESFDFYDLCDKYGIMLWQEFIQSSSGIDNTPSKLPKFLELIEKVSTEALKTKRNHACLTFWSGGNELTDTVGVPSTYEDKNIGLLKSLCDRHDPTHLMLPTSASGPSEFIDVENKGKSHDVHGHWKYLGASEHYSFYNKSDSLLHSEFGCDGMTNPDKIGRFLSKQHHKVFSMAENPVWRHHGEWWDTLGRERAIFGEFAKDDLLTFVKVSQVIQGDGLRYILDSNRRRKFKNAGSIIWQYNEPYPNISCTSLADYWGDPKLALEYVAQSYRPTNVSLKHESLVYSPGDMFFGEVYAVCDFGKAQAKISVVARDEDGKVIFEKSENVEIGEDEAIKVCEVKFPVGSSPCYHVSLKLDDGKDTICSNYFFLVKGENGYCDINPVVKIYDGQRGKNAQILF